MTITEKQRHQLFTRATEVLGADEAATMMEYLTTAASRELATGGDLRELREGVRGEMGDLREGLRGEMADLRTEMAELRGEMAELRTELRTGLADVRTELHQQIGRQTRVFVTWLLASQTALVGLFAVIVAAAV